MAIKTLPATARDMNGDVSPARVTACECGGQTWYILDIFVAGGLHRHVQCLGCGTTYCDGKCSAVGHADGQTSAR